MKCDNSKKFILKDSKTSWDEKWKHIGLRFLIFIIAIPRALKALQVLTLQSFSQSLNDILCQISPNNVKFISYISYRLNKKMGRYDE
jgi:hypothetical protein